MLVWLNNGWINWFQLHVMLVVSRIHIYISYVVASLFFFFFFFANGPTEYVLHSHIHEYGHVRNGHRMFIMIERIKNIEISKFENT